MRRSVRFPPWTEAWSDGAMKVGSVAVVARVAVAVETMANFAVADGAEGEWLRTAPVAPHRQREQGRPADWRRDRLPEVRAEARPVAREAARLRREVREAVRVGRVVEWVMPGPRAERRSCRTRPCARVPRSSRRALARARLPRAETPAARRRRPARAVRLQPAAIQALRLPLRSPDGVDFKEAPDGRATNTAERRACWRRE